MSKTAYFTYDQQHFLVTGSPVWTPLSPLCPKWSVRTAHDIRMILCTFTKIYSRPTKILLVNSLVEVAAVQRSRPQIYVLKSSVKHVKTAVL